MVALEVPRVRGSFSISRGVQKNEHGGLGNVSSRSIF